MKIRIDDGIREREVRFGKKIGVKIWQQLGRSKKPKKRCKLVSYSSIRRLVNNSVRPTWANGCAAAWKPISIGV